MNRQEFDAFRDDHYRRIVEINTTKGGDYAGDEDALANFKDAAAKLGVTPMQVWAVYHHKHQSAIDTFIREGKVQSEGIEGRIHDAILYLFLLLGLIDDVEPEEKPESVIRQEIHVHDEATPAIEKAYAAINTPGCTHSKMMGVDLDREQVVCERIAAHGDLHWGHSQSGERVEWRTGEADTRSR